MIRLTPSPELRAQIEYLIPEDVFLRTLGGIVSSRLTRDESGNPKMFSWATYCDCIEEQIRNWHTNLQTPYLTSPIYFHPIVGSSMHVPVVFVKDRCGTDKIVPTIFLENLDIGFAEMYSGQVDMRGDGISHAIIPVHKFDKLIKKYGRYEGLHTYKVGRATASEVQAECVRHTPATLEYWASRGIAQHISNDVEQLSHFGYDGWYTVVCDNGVGVFSLSSTQLYWDFTRHGNDPHLGNNILLQAVRLCKQLDLPLNLGVGYYNWKFDRWGAERHLHPSIRACPPLWLDDDLKWALSNHRIIEQS